MIEKNKKKKKGKGKKKRERMDNYHRMYYYPLR